MEGNHGTIDICDFLRALLRDVRGNWKALALTDIAYKLLAFIVLTPIVSVAFHLFLAASGRHIVADEDILQFVQEPIGWSVSWRSAHCPWRSSRWSKRL